VGHQYTDGVYVKDYSYNASKLEASGIDYDMQINQETDFGVFTYKLKANHLISQKQPSEVGGICVKMLTPTLCLGGKVLCLLIG
jgi:hypothetical protein